MQQQEAEKEKKNRLMEIRKSRKQPESSEN